jgi:sulfur carrier protein ThiS
MRIRVRLYGTLRGSIPAEARAEGIEVEIPEGATASDLLTLLGISESSRASVVVDGRVLASDERLKAGAPVGVFQAIGGG